MEFFVFYWFFKLVMYYYPGDYAIMLIVIQVHFKEAVKLVQFMAGFKGEGKTRKMIDLANANAKVTDGSLVFIDDDKRHIFDLHRDIRFVEASKGILESYREFVCFVWGILTQNSDIKHIYVDGLTNIVVYGAINNDTLIMLKNQLVKFSEEYHVDFTISMHYDRDILPDEIKALLV